MPWLISKNRREPIEQNRFMIWDYVMTGILITDGFVFGDAGFGDNRYSFLALSPGFTV
jgi:hypothetical protein